MATPSIQSFYQKESPRYKPSSRQPAGVDDGFTANELTSSNPLSRNWRPAQEYDFVSISGILQGKGHVHFAGRLVNFRPAAIDKNSMHYSRPYHYLVIKDDTGAIGVKLTPLGIPVSTFVLGQLISVWATYVCEPPSNYESVPYVLTCTPVNPQPGTQQFLRIEPESCETYSQYRTPLDCTVAGSQPKCFPGLVTLGSYLKTGHDEVRGLRVLVCVRSVGNRKQVRPLKRDAELELREVTVYDHTASCVLTLWESQVASAVSWQANDTILLISSPKWKPSPPSRNAAAQADGSISIDYLTMLDVDPDFSDAHWLRKWAKERTKKEEVSTPFPADLWNVDVAMHGPVRALFTIAEVEDFARGEPVAIFTGKLSVVVLDVNLVDLWFKKTLCCVDCCGLPLYANSPVATCKHCSSQRTLRLNPRIIGTVADETGCLEKGKQVWNPRAWRELIFPEEASSPDRDGSSEEEEVRRIWERITADGQRTLREIESLLLYARVTLTFGWSGEVGRLCVLGVEW